MIKNNQLTIMEHQNLSEEYLSDNKKLNTVILRFFNVTGKFYIKENKINKND